MGYLIAWLCLWPLTGCICVLIIGFLILAKKASDDIFESIDEPKKQKKEKDSTILPLLFWLTYIIVAQIIMKHFNI